MFARFSFPWLLIDASRPDFAPRKVMAGVYELERIRNPYGYTDHAWLVMKGTVIGAPETYWQEWQSTKNRSFQIAVSPDRRALDSPSTI